LRYLHTMVRVTDVEKSLDFYCNKLGMKEVRRTESEAGRYTLIFLAAPEDAGRAAAEKAPLLELTYNWDPEVYGEGRNFGHLAFEVDDIYATCDRLMKSGVTISRPPRDGRMAFIRSPDNISIELLQKGDSKPKSEPWASMPNTVAPSGRNPSFRNPRRLRGEHPAPASPAEAALTGSGSSRQVGAPLQRQR
jgi:lactoylglutathione lyase